MDTLQELNRGLKIDLEKDTLHYIRKSFHDMHIISYNRFMYIYISVNHFCRNTYQWKQLSELLYLAIEILNNLPKGKLLFLRCMLTCLERLDMPRLMTACMAVEIVGLVPATRVL